MKKQNEKYEKGFKCESEDVTLFFLFPCTNLFITWIFCVHWKLK